MKKGIFAAALLFACNAVSFAQCDTKLILTSSTTEYLDSNNVVQKSVPEKTTIKVNDSTLSIAPGENNEMTGTIKEKNCNWKIPYKEGKSVIKSTITDESGDVKNATLTLEGKDGKVTLVFEAEEMPGQKIRVAIDTFEEAK